MDCKTCNSLPTYFDLRINRDSDIKALMTAKAVDAEMASERKLTKVHTFNGVVYTTNPQKYIEYNEQYSKPIRL